MATNAQTTAELARVKELWSYDIVGMAPEPEFNAIVELAARICGVPMAAISLAESERLWFKAQVGLASAEMNRDGAFCDHVVTSGAPLIIGDATCHPRFAHNGLVCGEAHVRAYLGEPLTVSSGAVVGSLCVIDQKEREWTPLERDPVRTLAAQVVARLELRRATMELTGLWEDHRALEARVLTGPRDERRRMAAELHDGLGQELTGLSFLVTAARKGTHEPETRSALSQIEKLLRSAIENCRQLARGHLSFGFEHGSLRDSLERIVPDVATTTGRQCTLEWRSTLPLRDRTVAYHLYRIAQEAVTNAVRHSGCDSIRVSVSVHDGKIRLEVTDNGRGLSGQVEADTAGVGLETMRFRANAIGASLIVRNGESGGLLVRCELALPAAPGPAADRGATGGPPPA